MNPPAATAGAAPDAFPVTAADAGERLDRFLARCVPHVSRMRLRLAIDEGLVFVNGAPAAAGARLSEGDRVAVAADLSGATAMTPEPIPLTIRFEDAHVAVVEKPAGLIVHPAGRHRSGTLANALAHHFNVAGGASPPIRPGIVHRLDRATSGLLVVAKTQDALSDLTVQFQQGRVEKRYLALVHGHPAAGCGIWDAPIGSDPEARPRWGVRPGGRPARTRFRVLQRFPLHALLELEPLTGRTNQLRLHCAHFGHPIAGDELFGRGPEPPGRLFLHASMLGFTHPATRGRLVFESPPPPELAAYLDALIARS